ncbi:MAG: helix-hairpin-helix domain-containing protein, partial [Methanoregulaceae archaeon]|nr:helix-hairpin-helix domain-containing protein [Methanoregulaceae archaeon]
DIRIRHLRSQSQFIGCTSYPECGFNIGLPRVQWGFAIRTDDVCPVHGLHHVRLVKKGARPWEIGCPLCHHISSNAETLELMKSMRGEYHEKLRAHHLYTVYELAKTPPGKVASILGVEEDEALRVIHDAEDVLELLRKRSDCRKFVRKHLPPRRGRSHAAILKKLQSTGVYEVADLARIDPAVLRSAGVGEHEAEVLRSEAARLSGERALKSIGIPTVSLKKYQEAGVVSAEDLAGIQPAWLAAKTGLSPETVHRHVETAARALGTPIPEKFTKAQIERGKRSLLAVQGLGEATMERLLKAGVVNAGQLAGTDAETLAGKTGIPVGKIREYQKRATEVTAGGR